IVSDILESNGSSSMATVCGGSLALFDAGVPMTAACAGVAMGLIKEADRVAVLTDILGTEDALGDMDFKVAGTRQGVTSIQMDIKIMGLDFKIIAEALEKAKQARLHILDIMDQVMPKPRSELSKYAPRIITIQIRPDKIGDLIGPKGKTIRGIQEQTGAEINVDDNGMVTISAVGEGGERARDMIQVLVQEPEVGKIYEGVVKSTTAFGPLGGGGHLGAQRQRPRAPPQDGRVAPARAHGVQGHRAPQRAGDRAGARVARRLARRLHLARHHRVPGAGARFGPAARARCAHR